MLAHVARKLECVVAMESCATAHGWGSEFETPGHDVRLIPLVRVKPFVKSQANDVVVAEAIVELFEPHHLDRDRVLPLAPESFVPAGQRPTMHHQSDWTARWGHFTTDPKKGHRMHCYHTGGRSSFQVKAQAGSP